MVSQTHAACTEGTYWPGTATGTETTLNSTNVYVSGSNCDAAVLVVSDVFGWTLPNSRLLADHFAREANVTAYLPDFFDGEVLDPRALYAGKINLMDFVRRNSKEIRRPEILEFAAQLKQKHKKIGAVAYCYGGWAVFELGAKGSDLIDCISAAHPSFLTESEIQNVGVPTQILAPETDTQLTPALKSFCNTVIPTLGVPYSYEFFPGLSHGFANRADINDKPQRRAVEQAKSAVVRWLRQHLHEAE